MLSGFFIDRPIFAWVIALFIAVLGGAAMDGPRHIWWNFVSSSRERIEQAKADWTARRMGLVPGDEAEWIPLPENARVQAATRPGEPPTGNAPAA
jgi:hypothetical protein